MGNDNYDPVHTPDDRDRDKRILTFLKGLPSLIFSDTGVKNICKRFNITPEQLQDYITVINDPIETV